MVRVSHDSEPSNFSSASCTRSKVSPPGHSAAAAASDIVLFVERDGDPLARHPKSAQTRTPMLFLLDL